MEIGRIHGAHDGIVESITIDENFIKISIKTSGKESVFIELFGLKSYILDQFSDMSIVESGNIVTIEQFLSNGEYSKYVKYISVRFSISSFAIKSLSKFVLVLEFVNGELIVAFFDSDQ